VQHFRKANLDPLHNHWRRVFDFSKDVMSLPNPHWSLMDISASVPWEISLEDHGVAGAPENPVPITAAPADEDDDQSLGATVAAFDIRTTSQAEAQRALAQLKPEAIAPSIKPNVASFSVKTASATAAPPKTILPGRTMASTGSIAPAPAPAPAVASVPVAGGFWERLNASKAQQQQAVPAMPEAGSDEDLMDEILNDADA
jgi:hypothetical protein